MAGTKRKRSYGGKQVVVYGKPQASSYKRRKRSQSSYKAASYGKRSGETKYVDGYRNKTASRVFLGSADDTWSATEANPRQASAVYGCLPVPRQGTNYADRDGRRIFMKNIRINGQINWGSVDSQVPPANLGNCRIVIVKDTRTNGVALSGENVIGAGLGSDGNQTLSGDGGTINLPTNPDGWGRYKVVYDKTYESPPLPAWGDNTNAGNTNSMISDFSIKIKCNCDVNFNASTGEVGSIIDNSYHMLIGSSAGAGDNMIDYYARTSFTG